MELEIFYLVHAPANLPADLRRSLNAAATAALGNTTTRERFVTAGMLAASGENSPDRAKRTVETELARFREIAARTGIRISG